MVDAGAPEERYAALVEALRGEAGVTVPTGSRGPFGSAALKVDGRIFAMLYEGRLVVKLPRARVEALVDDGHGENFGRNGRPMREWLSVASESQLAWRALADEARAFVATR